MKQYFRFLSVLYFIGFNLHLLDVFDLRLKFSEMSLGWKLWIIYLLIFDFITALGLFQNKFYGEICFLIISFSQLGFYLGFPQYFGEQNFLILYHFVCLGIYLILRLNPIKFVH